MEVKVINNQVERSLRELKRGLIREGLFKELKKRRYYNKPCVKAKLKREDAEKTRHKDRKRAAARARALL
ncbi:MAG: 30S ribosomal protein S21 [Proteobacteria bacterium]|nr:30S ribosomal protein S21 [Pseudomonadota bacterium]